MFVFIDTESSWKMPHNMNVQLTLMAAPSMAIDVLRGYQNMRSFPCTLIQSDLILKTCKNDGGVINTTSFGDSMELRTSQLKSYFLCTSGRRNSIENGGRLT